ncbi:MAG: family hydrolase [Gammaproteobacteria bacterium]|jgi:HAD superfamily hydrolase (TIGR01509 family)|nr:family hydrolase [Gammaproteobacteria bacterium]
MRPPLPVVSIFDVEGTLVDSVPLQLESWRATLQTAGHSFTHADLQPFSGMDGIWMLDQLLPKEPPEIKQRLLKAQGESYRSDFMLRAEPFPGVQQLFAELKQHAVLIGIATTCQKDELAAYDKRLGILELTDAVSCGEMVKHGKPDPSLFQACLARLQITDAACAVAVGDTPYDARAAKQLGMLSVGVITGGFSEQALREAGCDGVFDQVQAINAIWRRGSEPLIRSDR